MNSIQAPVSCQELRSSHQSAARIPTVELGLAGLLVVCLQFFTGAPVQAGSLRLVGHLGGAVLTEDSEGVDSTWTTGVADLAVEWRFFGPLSVGVGGEAILEEGKIGVVDKNAGFAYVKARPALPFRPYVGLGFELRKSGSLFDGSGSGDGWNQGLIFLSGFGIKLSKVSFDLEIRRVDSNVSGSSFRFWSLRPGVTIWL